MIFATKAIAMVVLPAVFLGGCGAPHLATVREAKTTLVGQDVKILRRCIGEPLRVEPRAGSAEESGPVYAFASAQRRGEDGLLRAAPQPDADALATACMFRFQTRSGRILAVESENRAGWGFGSIRRCSALVERCLVD